MASQKVENLPKNCEHIIQGVAKLSAFRLPPKNFRRSEGTLLPLAASVQLQIPGKGTKNDASTNGTIDDTKLPVSIDGGTRPLLSSSSNSLLRVATPAGTGAVVGPGGKRLLSLDSAAHLATVHNEQEWLRTQRKLVADAAELRRQRDQVVCCASVGASYAFLAISVALSLSVVIAVCLFLHSFVPTEPNRRHLTNASSSLHNANNGFLSTASSVETREFRPTTTAHFNRQMPTT